MDIKQQVNLHNKFEITVCDAKTREEKQKAYAYNVITDNYMKMRLMQYSGDNQVSYANSMGYIGVGTGSGTPAITDTALFTALLHRSATLIETHYEYPTSYITRQIVINADEYNDNTFTEVGMEAYYTAGMWSTANYHLCTHAMIQDSEGNQISIQKTDTDVVYITATIYCTFTRSGFGDNGIFPLAANNILVKYLLLGYTSLNVKSGRFEVENAAEVENDYIFSKNFTFGNCTGDYANLTLNFPTMTILDSEWNNHLVKTLVVSGIGGFQFPDSSKFADYDITHLVLGEGDGTTTDFDIKCPLIKSESVKVYVDDVEQSSSDYTVDYESNCIDAYENYYTASMKVNGTTVVFGDMANRSPSTSYMYADPLYWGIYPISEKLYPSNCAVTAANPIFIDFGSAKECNKLRIDQGISESNISNLVIEYSNDNSTWTPVTYTRTTTAYSSSMNYHSFTFPLTSARYWRVYIPNYSWWYALFTSSDSTIGTRDNTSHIKSTFFLGKSVPGLSFNTAPANGSTIDVSYKINVPFKTSNNLMRITCSAVLQRS